MSDRPTARIAAEECAFVRSLSQLANTSGGWMRGGPRSELRFLYSCRRRGRVFPSESGSRPGCSRRGRRRGRTPPRRTRGHVTPMKSGLLVRVRSPAPGKRRSRLPWRQSARTSPQVAQAVASLRPSSSPTLTSRSSSRSPARRKSSSWPRISAVCRARRNGEAHISVNLTPESARDLAKTNAWSRPWSVRSPSKTRCEKVRLRFATFSP
jgi:hypothetical protein